MKRILWAVAMTCAASLGWAQERNASSSPAMASAREAKKKEGKVVRLLDGLKYEDLKVGTGAQPKTGQTVVVHYTGWLTDGKKFDSSVDRGRPFEFPLGEGRVIKGWDEGVATMKVGGKRTLLIPPQLGYGDRGAGNVIPPGSTLVFEIELLSIEQ